jgi:hypothetical protein
LGTEYHAVEDIRNEAVARAINGRRRWRPKNVDFVAFMIGTMRSVGNASRRSFARARSDAFDWDRLDEAASGSPHSSAEATSPEEQRIEEQEREKREEHVALQLRKIDQHFTTDAEVSFLVRCLKEGDAAAAICDKAGWETTQYDTVRRRFRRGVLDLFFMGRRKP